MPAADEMAWEARLPWAHPRTPIYKRWRPTADPVPERFTIVVVDLLATLTFDPVLGRNPRLRYKVRRPTLASTIFEPNVVIYPLAWTPVLPTGSRRSRRELRRSRNQSALVPPPSSVIAAQRMTWLATLPTRTSRRRLRARGTGTYFALEFTALGAGITCTDLAGETLTSPGFITEAVTAPALITESLTSPALIDEEVC